MFGPLLIAAFLILPQKPEAKPDHKPETGIIAGTVVPAEGQTLAQPAQVVLLNTVYSNLWNSDVQKRLDAYWERYKPAFAAKKEFFFEVSRMAHRDAITYIVMRMRRDLRNDISTYVQDTAAGGKFEFKNVPFGEYRILALGKAGDRDAVWQDSVEIQSPIPQFLTLKKRLP